MISTEYVNWEPEDSTYRGVNVFCGSTFTKIYVYIFVELSPSTRICPNMQ